MLLLLIVEDDRDCRDVISAMLSEAGYSVHDACDGPRALQKMRSIHPDLVLLDYGLPAPKDGEDFLRAKVADTEFVGIPVVVMSGFNLPRQIDGAVAVIKKPFDFDGLIALIQRFARASRKPDTNIAA